MLMLESASGIESSDTIMFSDLSTNAKKTALEFVGVKHPSEMYWDVFPIAYKYSDDMDQSEIDDEALSQIGFYRDLIASDY